MASIKKIGKNEVGFVLHHNNRTADDETVHTNETIDLSLTPENYHFKKGSVEEMHRIIDENNYYYMNRQNSNPIVEIVVTLPQGEAPVFPEDEKKFFQSVYNFYANDFGEKNILNAVVHKDEITPHLHLDVIPVRPLPSRAEMSPAFRKLVEKEEKRTGKPMTEGVSSKDCFTRSYLLSMHPRLSDWVTKDLGYRPEILNGKTAGGNRTVLELKNEFYEKVVEQTKENVGKLQEEIDLLNKNIQIITSKIDEMQLDKRYFDAVEMLDAQSRLMVEKELYRKALLQNGIKNIKVPAEYREIIQKPKSVTGKVTYKSGLIVPKSEYITVVETYVAKPRSLPQQYIIDHSPILSRFYEHLKPREPKLIEAENQYLLFPTDDLEYTFRNLIRLKERESEFKKIAMPKISNDPFNITEMILRQCRFDTDYYYTEQIYMEDLEKDRIADAEKNDEEN